MKIIGGVFNQIQIYKNKYFRKKWYGFGSEIIAYLSLKF
jgi:hypothetical protein